MITTIEEAKRLLTEARLDAIADHGEAGADDAHNDLIRYVADMATGEVAAELLRREGVTL